MPHVEFTHLVGQRKHVVIAGNVDTQNVETIVTAQVVRHPGKRRTPCMNLHIINSYIELRIEHVITFSINEHLMNKEDSHFNE
jgi:hypothetical protein